MMPEKKLPDDPPPSAAPTGGTARAPSATPSATDESGRASSAFSLLGTAGTMGMHMVSGPLVGGGLGWLIDHWAGSGPWGAGIGVLLGVAAGFRNVWVDARYLLKAEERNHEDQAGRNR